MLHKLSRLHGAHVHAKDGGIGHIDNFLVDEKTLGIRYLVIDTSNWIGGKEVAVSPSVIHKIDWEERDVWVDATRAAIKDSPVLESLDIPITEQGPPFTIL